MLAGLAGHRMARVQVASLRWLYGPSQVERSCFDWLGVLFALSRAVLPPQLVVLAFLVWAAVCGGGSAATWCQSV